MAVQTSGLVSIIVPNYNHAAYLPERIESILKQSYQNFELILLDDASTDESVAILESYANHPKVSVLLKNERNSGSPFHQWQKGLELAKGQYIWIAESDDVADIRFLERLLSLLEQTAIGIAYCNAYLIDAAGEQTGICDWAYPLAPEKWKTNHTEDGKLAIRDYLRFRSILPNASAVVFKKSLYDELSEATIQTWLTYRYCGDWYFFVQLAYRTQLAFCSDFLSYFRRTTASLSVSSGNLLRKKRIRLQEYIAVITACHHLLGIHTQFNPQQHFWIVAEWRAAFRTSFWHFAYWFPPLPLALRLAFYKSHFQFLKRVEFKPLR